MSILMYEFLYNYVKPKSRDTDSFLIYIKNGGNLCRHCKRLIGLMEDELIVTITMVFAALRLTTYIYIYL